MTFFYQDIQKLLIMHLYPFIRGSVLTFVLFRTG